MAETNWSDKVAQLLNEDSRLNALNELKQDLEALSQREVSEVAQNLQLPVIFDCLNDSNKEQVELACEVLSLCMSRLNLGESTNRYDVFIERALNHPFSAVKLMALNEIERNIGTEQLVVELSKRSSLLALIIKCIGDNDLAVAKKAAEIIVKLGTDEVGIRQLLLPDTVKVFQEVLDISEVVRLRVFEIVVDLASKSEDIQKLLEAHGFFSSIVKELENNDVLLRINIVELLARLVIKQYGYAFLESQGCIDKLFHQLEDDSDPVTLQLSEPAILKFFGHMTRVNPSNIISKYPMVINRIFENLESDDLIVFGVSLDTFGFIVLTDEGKFALDGIAGNKRVEAIKSVVSKVGHLPTELKIRALKVIENLLHADEPESKVALITLKWYKIMGDKFIDQIVSYAKNPFGEIRYAGLGVLLSLSSQQWGQEAIQSVPGLIEFLLDRNAERIKECKEIKYEIIKHLANSTVFDHAILLRLRAYVKEGPFYVYAVTEVAVEGND